MNDEHKPVHKAKNAKLIYIIAGIVVALGLLGLIVSGYVYVGVKKPYQVVHSVASVCKQEVIDRVNKFYTTKETADTDSARSIAADIQKMAHFQEDPTCLMIVITASQYYNSDLGVTKAYVTSLKKLIDQGNYPDNHVENYMSLGNINSIPELEGE